MAQYFVYEQPPYFMIQILPLLIILFAAYLGYLEIRAKHLQYSKFCNNNTSFKNDRSQFQFSSRIGMLLFYAPSCIAVLASFFFVSNGGARILLLKFALTTHFLKRVLEVLCVHKYTGGSGLYSTILISVTYLLLTIGMIFIQHLTQGLQAPLFDLKYVGVALFFVGISGNFYHHILLSNLRVKGEKGYKIPKGGLFSLVICPHYLFEILTFFGIFLISQTMIALSGAVSSMLYLIGRSYATRKWYLSKFEAFPNEVKALVPYVF